MKITSIKYLIAEGFGSVLKNRSMSFASISTIAICIFMLGVSFFITENIEYNVNNVETDINITAFLKNSVSEDDAESVRQMLLGSDLIKDVNFISSDAELEKFLQEDELQVQDEEIIKELKEDNPLPDSLQIILHDNKNEGIAVELVKGMPQIDDVRRPKEAMRFMNSFKEFTKGVFYFWIALLIILGIVLIGNTIKLTVLARQNEIKVLKYIGATDAFVKLPFMIEGMILGLTGTTMALVILHFGYNMFINLFSGAVNMADDTLINFLEISEIYKSLVPIAMTIGLGMGIVGSVRSMKKHLKV